MVRSLDFSFDHAVNYASSDSRTSDWYLSQADKAELKHYRIYQKGDGIEEEIYEFKNAVLHSTPTGEIQGWYVELPDLSQDPKAKDAPKDLMARAQWTLLYDRIWDLHLHGGLKPDFTIPKPVAFDSDLNPLSVKYRIEGEALNRLTFAFSTPSYPALLDPTLIPAVATDAIITGEGVGTALTSGFGGGIAIGDLNNDGKQDLAVGAENYSSNTGRVYLFYQDSTLWGTSACTTGCIAAGADRIITGPTSGYFGWNISISDINNDLKKDLIIGSSGYSSSTGGLFIFFQDGSWGTAACTTGCLATNADRIITGQASSSFALGFTVGDLNNDGKNDLAVGAQFYSSNTGRIYLFYQDSAGWGTASCTTGCLAANADHIIQGEATSNYFGSSIAIGDLNNDTKNDLAVGANGYSSYLGRVYVYYQDATLWGTSSCTTGCLAANADHIITGEASSYFGNKVVSGDLNNDGRVDLAVGAYGYSSSTGRVYILLQDASYSGWGTVACTTGCTSNNADQIIQGETTSTYFGVALGIADLSNDGRADLVVGAQQYSTYTGRVYLFLQDATYSGWGSVACTTGCLAANADTIITGAATNNYFGRTFAIGDLDNDSDNDLAIGAEYYNSTTGRVYLFLQDATLWGTSSCTTGCLAANADTILTGQLGSTRFGGAVAIGDLNNDGRDDLAVSATNYETYTGRVYLFLQDTSYSGWGTVACTAGCLAANADYIIQGQTTSNYFGSSIAIGDLNNDAKNDLAIGAIGYSSNTGRVYLFLQDATLWGTSGCTTGCLAANADYIIQGQASTFFGNSLAIGDLNYDSKTDLAVGAHYYSTQTGRVYLFLQDATLWGTSGCTTGCLAANADYNIQGQTTSNQFGLSMAIGDLNNDARADIVVGANLYSTQTGRAYIFYQDSSYAGWGSASCVGSDASPCYAANADAIIQGQATYDWFGNTMTIGDLSNDSRNDLVVGALTAGGTNGRVYIFLQDSPYVGWGTATCTTGCLAGNADYIISGQAVNDNLSTSFAIGDINSDGKNDLVAGAPRYSSDTGRVYVFLQDATLWGTSGCTTGCLAANADTIITGQATGSYLGNSLAIGDLNNDDKTDLSAGAPLYNGTGRTYLSYSIGQTQSSLGSVSVLNQAPSVPSNTSDGGSSSITPTNAGSDVSFSATVTDNNSDQWYLLICKTSGAPIPGNDAPPTCNGGAGNLWAVSTAANSGSEATATYTTLDGDLSSNAWYAFACDKVAGTAACSASSQGSGTYYGSPFVVNHRPSLSTPVYVGTSFGVNSNIDPSFKTSFNFTTSVGSGVDEILAVALQTDGKIVAAGVTHNGSNNDFVVARYTVLGALDTTFNGTGIVTTAIGAGDDVAYSVAIQTDGKIVVAGTSSNHIAVARYTSAGALDTGTFGFGTGKMVLSGSPSNGYSVAIQSDGKIVVGGDISLASIDFAVARFNADGSADNSFDTDGLVTTTLGSSYDDIYDIVLQPDGKIVAAGASNGTSTDVAVVRYNTDGSLDTTFDSDGIAITPIGSAGDFGHSVALQSDGKIVVAGWSNNGSDDDVAVVRYTTVGALDTTFNGTGKVTTAIGTSTDYGYDVGLLPDGRIVVGGQSWSASSNDDFAVVRYNTNGSLDTTFNGTGKATTALTANSDYGMSLALQKDGKAILAGIATASTQDLAIVRYTVTGQVDAVNGGDVYIQAPALDATDSDLVTLYACSTNSFSNGLCTNTTLCAGTVASGGDAQCLYTNGNGSLPFSSGTILMWLFAKDEHGLVSSVSTSSSYTFNNAAPTLLNFSGSDLLATPAAGGSDTYSFVANLQDYNGDYDLTAADGVFFEDTVMNNDCTLNEQNCYLVPTCTVDTSYGNSYQAQIQCTATVFFTASASTNWEVHVNPTDGGGRRTTLEDSNINVTVNPLGGISTVESTLNYGTLNLGSLSGQQTITVQNAGNVATDVGIAGTDMTYSTDTIPRANQHWSGSNGFGYSSGYALVDNATPTSASTGCFNANLAVATVHTSMPSLPVYWLLLTPESIKSGTYTGSNSMSIITCQ